MCLRIHALLIVPFHEDLGLAQIFPMIDEATDAELAIAHTSFCDPYLLVVREDSSVVVLKAEATGDLDEVERGDALLATQWLSGCVHKPNGDDTSHLVYLLSAKGGLHVGSHHSKAENTLTFSDFCAPGFGETCLYCRESLLPSTHANYRRGAATSGGTRDFDRSHRCRSGQH